MTPTQKKNIRESIASYCKQAVGNEPRIHYSQQRPGAYFDNIGGRYIVLDCSMFVSNVFWNAGHDLHLYVADPLDYRYAGWGNTSSLEAFLRKHGSPVASQGFLVGDIARWGNGNHAHTAVCSKRGTAAAAEFTSHGREAGPNVVRLNYRDDLVGCWRHPALL